MGSTTKAAGLGLALLLAGAGVVDGTTSDAGAAGAGAAGALGAGAAAGFSDSPQAKSATSSRTGANARQTIGGLPKKGPWV